MYHALWDRRHEGATRISQCTWRYAPSALTYPSGPWVLYNMILIHLSLYLFLQVQMTISIGSDNGLALKWQQAITQTNDVKVIQCHKVSLDYNELIVNIVAAGDLWPLLPTEINSLGPSDAIWRQTSGSTLAQVMACCLTAPSHNLNQCWLIITKVEWHSSKGKFTRDTSAINHWNYLYT